MWNGDIIVGNGVSLASDHSANIEGCGYEQYLQEQLGQIMIGIGGQICLILRVEVA
jgi:hypothetical protein